VGSNIPPFIWVPGDFLSEKRDIAEKSYVARNDAEFPVLMMSRLQESATYLDVGANCGMTSLPGIYLNFTHAIKTKGKDLEEARRGKYHKALLAGR